MGGVKAKGIFQFLDPPSELAQLLSELHTVSSFLLDLEDEVLCVLASLVGSLGHLLFQHGQFGS